MACDKNTASVGSFVPWDREYVLSFTVFTLVPRSGPFCSGPCTCDWVPSCCQENCLLPYFGYQFPPLSMNLDVSKPWNDWTWLSEFVWLVGRGFAFQSVLCLLWGGGRVWNGRGMTWVLTLILLPQHPGAINRTSGSLSSSAANWRQSHLSFFMKALWEMHCSTNRRRAGGCEVRQTVGTQ